MPASEDFPILASAIPHFFLDGLPAHSSPCYARAMNLLERQNLIDRLQALLADAARGKGRVVALSGEAGIGKSALVRAFADLASENVRVLWGACEDLATPEPLGPLQEIARNAGWDLHGAIRHGGRLTAFSEARDVFDQADR